MSEHLEAERDSAVRLVAELQAELSATKDKIRDLECQLYQAKNVEVPKAQERCKELEQACTDLGNLLAAWHNEYQKTKPAQLANQTAQTIQRVRSLFEQ